MKYHRLYYLVISALTFSFLYSFVNPVNFHGLNKIQDKIKDDLIEDEVNEPFYSQYNKQKVKRDVKDIVSDEEKKIYKPNYYQRYLDSLYFSIITSCLLGYGDIYPITNLSKIMVSIQALITLSLILY
tara:strand:- start:2894 stop:3277 length:384 start_codon:yes stop_codon:yes gene_type:complete